jgi:hypothetical protein
MHYAPSGSNRNEPTNLYRYIGRPEVETYFKTFMLAFWR